MNGIYLKWRHNPNLLVTRDWTPIPSIILCCSLGKSHIASTMHATFCHHLWANNKHRQSINAVTYTNTHVQCVQVFGKQMRWGEGECPIHKAYTLAQRDFCVRRSEIFCNVALFAIITKPILPDNDIARKPRSYDPQTTSKAHTQPNSNAHHHHCSCNVPKLVHTHIFTYSDDCVLSHLYLTVRSFKRRKIRQQTHSRFCTSIGPFELKWMVRNPSSPLPSFSVPLSHFIIQSILGSYRDAVSILLNIFMVNTSWWCWTWLWIAPFFLRMDWWYRWKCLSSQGNSVRVIQISPVISNTLNDTHTHTHQHRSALSAIVHLYASFVFSLRQRWWYFYITNSVSLVAFTLTSTYTQPVTYMISICVKLKNIVSKYTI